MLQLNRLLIFKNELLHTERQYNVRQVNINLYSFEVETLNLRNGNIYWDDYDDDT